MEREERETREGRGERGMMMTGCDDDGEKCLKAEWKRFSKNYNCKHWLCARKFLFPDKKRIQENNNARLIIVQIHFKLISSQFKVLERRTEMDIIEPGTHIKIHIHVYLILLSVIIPFRFMFNFHYYLQVLSEPWNGTLFCSGTIQIYLSSPFGVIIHFPSDVFPIFKLWWSLSPSLVAVSSQSCPILCRFQIRSFLLVETSLTLHFSIPQWSFLSSPIPFLFESKLTLFHPFLLSHSHSVLAILAFKGSQSLTQWRSLETRFWFNCDARSECSSRWSRFRNERMAFLHHWWRSEVKLFFLDDEI